MIKKVTTNSGSTYIVNEDTRFWRKNNDGWERLWWCKAFVLDNALQVETWSDISDLSEDRFPEVGEHLYIGSREVWYLSTPIISIEEVK